MGEISDPMTVFLPVTTITDAGMPGVILALSFSFVSSLASTRRSAR
jgi:hypothetical protein